MVIKKIVTFFILVLTLTAAVAQQNTIKGTVLDNKKTPLAGVSVTIKGTKKGSETDFKGNFEIKNTQKNQTLVLSYLGFKTKVIVINDKTNLGEIVLFEGNELLSEIVLKSRNNKFSRKKTAYVSKLPLKDLENPIVYSTITNELLESQIVTNFDDAMTNATGITKLWESTGRAPGEGTAYFSTRGFSVQPSLVDGMPGFTFSAVDPSYIERIEVIKGPSATLFGSTVSSFGGLINVVTKKPYKGFGGSVSYTGGSFGMNRVSADVNTPLGNNDDLFFRINTSYLTQDSFQDAGFRNTFFVAPSLSYTVNNRLNISVGIEYSNTEQTNPSMLFLRRGLPLVSNNIEQLGIDPNKSFTSNDITLTSQIFNTRAIADYKISDNWTSQTVFASTYSEAKGYYQYLIDGASAAFFTIPNLLGDAAAYVQNDLDLILGESAILLQDDVFARLYDKRDADAVKTNIQQNFIGDFKIGEVRNRLILGLDYVYRNANSRNKNGNPTLAQNSQFPNIVNTFNYAIPGAGDAFAAQLASFPYFDGFFSSNGEVVATSFTPNATYKTTKSDLDAIFDPLTANHISTSSQTFALYASNVVNITDNLTVNLGLRLDHFDQDGNDDDLLDDYTKTTFSPNAGILYQAIPNKLTLFTNYQTGFVNNDPSVNSDGTVDTFKPTKAIQFEGGIKTNFFKGKLNVGASYYNITVEDFVGSDPNSVLFPESLILNESQSEGIELEVNTNPLAGLNLRASYSYNDSKITDAYSETTGLQYDELQDRRPESAGPDATYNFWADYRLVNSDNKFLQNLGFGAGFNGTSEHITANNAVTGTFTLPSYTVFNSTIYYNTYKIRIGLKVNNITDETYYKGWSTVNAQAPRAFLGTIQYKF
ncbi:TonB-dependent receptor [Polaribacter sp. AHE13PA]|uniref:TonB-dependent receptor n=1 Tax=Polaribacter sp. AHE13PA TaxID=2745562 RepID=UPI001C4F0442|nr:TonB-dependent receptor [Polaribacter sp. AHE13PA]QXP67528.1 TonB-dependent receptor [Polaribacter sp. AHE13PA]